MPRVIASNLIAALALGAATAAPASASAVRGEVAGLAVTGRTAVRLVDTGQGARPFRLVRGRRVTAVGEPLAEFPALAADAAGHLIAAWDHAQSGGVRYSGRAAGRGGIVALGQGTGPVRLAARADGAAVLANPDRDGDIAITIVPGVTRPIRGDAEYTALKTFKLTRTGPLVRHFAAGLALRRAGPLVLDLQQTRRRSRLVLVGRGAPKAALQTARGVRQLGGALAATEGRIAVAYVRRGRPVLATAAPGGPWRRRVLPGRGVTGDPAVAITHGRVFVAWAQRTRAGGGVFAAVAGGRRRRVSPAGAGTGPPLLAAGPSGRVFAAWTAGGRARLRRLR